MKHLQIILAGLTGLILNAPPTYPVKSQVVVNPSPLPKLVGQIKPIEPLVAQTYEQLPVLPVPPPAGSHEDWMTQAGIPQSDWMYVDYIVTHESTWNYKAINPIGATGLCQSLPGSKMATIAADYLTNPVTQLKWCHKYAQERYGGWANAYSFWVGNRLW